MDELVVDLTELGSGILLEMALRLIENATRTTIGKLKSTYRNDLNRSVNMTVISYIYE